MATKQHCAYCFSVLLAQLEGRDTASVPAHFDTAAEYPLFVTWHKLSADGKSESLRGCIGNFSPLELGSGLREYALVSALRDTRFSPISLREVPRLVCAVSLLTDFEEAQDYMDWGVGKHGVWLEFKLPGSYRKQTATFLPEIAEEQGWSKRETVDHLFRKSGYEGVVTEDMRQAAKLTRYQSKKEHLSYADYQKMAA